MSNDQLVYLRLEDIDTGKRFRKEYNGKDDASLEALSADIGERGVLSSLVVADKNQIEDSEVLENETDHDKPYILMAGGRRLAGAAMADLETVPCRIYDHILSEEELRTVELHENTLRKDLSWQEKIALTKELHEHEVKRKGKKVSTAPDAPGHSMEDTAKMLGKHRSSVSRDIELAEAIEDIPELAEQESQHKAQKLYKKLKDQMVKEKKAEELRNKRNSTPDDQIRRRLANKYMVRDFFEGVKNVKSESIDFIEIDPPYAVDLQRKKKGGELTTRDYNEIDRDKYPNFMRNVFGECSRVLKPNGWIICWFGPEPWFEKIYKWMSGAGFQGNRLTGKWIKPSGQTMQPKYYMANAVEDFFYMRKGQAQIQQQGHKNWFDVKPIPPNNKVHPTERPIELMEEIINIFVWRGARGMVPFAGSGNTLLAGANLDMDFFGFDLTQSYKDDYDIKVYDSIPSRYKSHKRG